MKTPVGNTRLEVHLHGHVLMCGEVGSGRSIPYTGDKWHGKWEVKIPGEIKVPIRQWRAISSVHTIHHVRIYFTKEHTRITRKQLIQQHYNTW